MKRPVFKLILIKPTRYDDNGYPIQWLRGSLPSNTLISVNGLALDCKERQVLGSDVDISITAIDETTRRVKPAKLIKMIKSGGAGGLVRFVISDAMFTKLCLATTRQVSILRLSGRNLCLVSLSSLLLLFLYLDSQMHRPRLKIR